jgi:hypothetical protein
MGRLPVIMALIAAALPFAGCGGGSSGGRDPIQQVPAKGGLREKVAGAQHPAASDFPTAKGRTLQQLANSLHGGPQAALAGTDYIPGRNRLAFGMIDSAGKFIYGKSAVYVAPSPGAKARGPYPAPADILMTEPPYRSKQAATETDPFAAIYSAEVPLTKPGPWTVLAVTQSGGSLVAAGTRIRVKAPGQDRIPEVGEQAPRVQTDTLASVKGDESKLDTRQPPAPELHRNSFADVVGKEPVALLFSTPQLCQSRVCGPVTDIALQLQARYGGKMDFIHQEVYVDNDPNKGLRQPLQQFNLRTEPWLFVVDRSGRITARLEGSFGVKAFERAIQTAL